MSILPINADVLRGVGDYFRDTPERANKAARLAINQIADRKGIQRFRDRLNAEINFPTGYLSPSTKRLYVSRRASDNNLEAVITARSRPTSLARFAAAGTPVAGLRRMGVHVKVKRQGASVLMPGAFLVRLNRGASLTDDNYNVGLAIRLKPGEKLNKREMSPIQLSHNLYILYGPSPDQIFKSVAPEEAEHIIEDVADEFYRQYARIG